jgi:hypothetical protein
MRELWPELLATLFSTANMWLPTDVLYLRDKTQIQGYVVHTEAGYMTVLLRDSAETRQIELELVDRRVICRPLLAADVYAPPSAYAYIFRQSDRRNIACP